MSDSKLDKIDTKIDNMQEKLSSIDITLASQHEILKDHTRRSLANEKAVTLLADRLQPIITHVAIMQLCGKILMAVVGSEITWFIIRKVLNV